MAGYVIGSLFLPGLYMSNFASMSIAIFGGITLMKYLPESYDILINGVRSKTEPGAHLAVLGTTLLAFGAVYVGAFSLLYFYLDRPANWSGSAWSGFGRFCIGWGFCLMYLSPDVSKDGVRLPSVIWTTAAIVVALLAAYHVGVRVGEYRAQ